MRSNRLAPSTTSLAGRWAASACAALVVLAATGSAQSTRALTVTTTENPGNPGAFTLDFGDLGFSARGNITTTNYELSVDPIQGTARFVSYLQHVEPLTLPGGFSTGPITVEVVPDSSTGTYDPYTRTFSTSEMYAVSFTEDLSLFGLTSPVLLPSTSGGELVVDPVTGGQVSMDWSGVGQLGNPADPSNPFTFTYTCASNTVFPSTPESAVGLALIPGVVGLQLPPAIELQLVSALNDSLAHIQQGSTARAVRDLRGFLAKVNVLKGRLLSVADADALVAATTQTIALFGPGRLSDASTPGGRTVR